MAADRGDTAGQGVERVSGVRLTADERSAHGRKANEFPQGQLVYSLTDVEAILAARLAPVEALAAEWEHVGGGDDMGHNFAVGFNLAHRACHDALRAALSQPTAAPSPDREPEPTPSEES